ncbi:MAG: GFA family protein [Pseudomonadota bacterium]
MTAIGAAHFNGYCHCDDCRRSNGAPVVSFTSFKADQITWQSRESLCEWRNGRFARHFCKICGSPVAYTDDDIADEFFFYVGFMSDATEFPPEHHSFYGEKIRWLALCDELPKSEYTSF